MSSNNERQHASSRFKPTSTPSNKSSAAINSKRRLVSSRANQPSILDTCDDSAVSASDLRALVNSLKHSQLHYLHSLVLCRLQHDPLRSLHAPVFSLMINYLDLVTSTRCARLTMSWSAFCHPLTGSRFNATSGHCSRRIVETVWRCIFAKRLPALSTMALCQLPSLDLPSTSPHLMYASIRLDHLLRRNWTRNLCSVSLECHANAVITCLYVDPITGGRGHRVR